MAYLYHPQRTIARSCITLVTIQIYLDAQGNGNHEDDG